MPCPPYQFVTKVFTREFMFGPILTRYPFGLSRGLQIPGNCIRFAGPPTLVVVHRTDATLATVHLPGPASWRNEGSERFGLKKTDMCMLLRSTPGRAPAQASPGRMSCFIPAWVGRWVGGVEGGGATLPGGNTRIRNKRVARLPDGALFSQAGFATEMANLKGWR